MFHIPQNIICCKHETDQVEIEECKVCKLGCHVLGFSQNDYSMFL